MATYKTAPAPITTMPKGVPYIISNELAERFSFYGMRTILVIFMTKYLIGENGQLDVMSHEEAQGYIHLFISAAYFFPLLGAFLSDVFLGKYTTIISLSLVYCLGHAALALDETRTGLFVGLVLIAIGAGGIKPCVSAHVGDQFGTNNEHLLSKVFGWFYFSINLGAFVSSLLTPYLLSRFGPQVAFGVPGVLMFLATVCFWMGRKKFVHIPPGGMKFVRESLSREGLRAVGKPSIV
ncbi:MAG: MFS transporter, partial [Candidatus Hydrogenedentes bacterium]|nr:MFS transporter [Candidatus Hydrogenedentota bacterium]